MSAHPQVSAAAAIDSDAKGTFVLFAAYLVLIVVEYLGLANEFGALKATRFTTLLSYGLAAVVITRFGLSAILAHRETKLLVALILMTIASVFYAYVQKNAYDTIRPFIDALMLFVITYRLVDRRSRLDAFATVCVLVAVILFMRNADKLGSTVRAGGFRAAYFLGDGNDFAWGMNVLLPVIATLMLGRRRLVTRAVGLIGCAACVMAIVATQSRGATLGLGAGLLYYWLGVAKKKTLGAVVVVLAVVGVVLIAPSQYFSRIESIGQYEEDNSAQARLQVWGAATRMALGHPLGVGAGNFNSVYGRFYRPDPNNARVVWGNARWLSAHSVFFKVLGEYGFPGLLLLLGVLVTAFRDNVRSRRLLASAGDRTPISEYWPVLLNMSLVAYAVNGVFLGGFLYPHLFLIVGLTLSVKHLAARAAVTVEGAAQVRLTPPVPYRMLARAARVVPASRLDRPEPTIPSGGRS
jgi:probable O-glycosylation ligase (exosortase A-associated)